jgi:hypothetical protein
MAGQVYIDYSCKITGEELVWVRHKLGNLLPLYVYSLCLANISTFPWYLKSNNSLYMFSSSTKSTN